MRTASGECVWTKDEHASYLGHTVLDVWLSSEFWQFTGFNGMFMVYVLACLKINAWSLLNELVALSESILS